MIPGVQDLDKLILNFLDDKSLLNLSSTNKYFNLMCNNEDFWESKILEKKNFRYIPKGKNKIIYYGLSDLYDFADKIVKVEDYEILEWLKSMYIFPNTLKCCKYDNLNILEWLFKNQRNFTSVNIGEAINGEQPEVIKWLIDKGIDPSYKNVNDIVGKGYIEIIEILLSKNIVPKTVSEAIFYDRPAIIKYLINKDISFSPEDINEIAGAGYIDILDMLYERNIIPTSFVKAISKNKIKVVEWLIEKKIRINVSDVRDVNNFEILDLLENYGIVLPESEIEEIIYIENIIMLSYFHRKGLLNNSHVNKALDKLKMKCVKFFIDVGIYPDQSCVDYFYERMTHNKISIIENVKVLIKREIFPTKITVNNIFLEFLRKIYCNCDNTEMLCYLKLLLKHGLFPSKFIIDEISNVNRVFKVLINLYNNC